MIDTQSVKIMVFSFQMGECPDRLNRTFPLRSKSEQLVKKLQTCECTFLPYLIAFKLLLTSNQCKKCSQNGMHLRRNVSWCLSSSRMNIEGESKSKRKNELMSWTLYNCWYFIRDYVDSFPHSAVLYIECNFFDFLSTMYVQPENYGVEMCIRQEHIIYAFKGCFIYHSRIIFSAVPLRVCTPFVLITKNFCEKLRYDGFKSKISMLQILFPNRSLMSKDIHSTIEQADKLTHIHTINRRKGTTKEKNIYASLTLCVVIMPIHSTMTKTLCVPLLSYIMRSNGMEWSVCVESQMTVRAVYFRTLLAHRLFACT